MGRRLKISRLWPMRLRVTNIKTSMPEERGINLQTDVTVIGAGLIGTAIARELSRFQSRVVLLEKQADVCSGASKATSAIVHSSFHEKTGTLKAKLGVEGNAMFTRLCAELEVPFKRLGSLLIAVNDEDLKILKFKKEQGEANGVPGLRIIDRQELQQMEPNISPAAIAALYAPTGAIVSPYELVIAMMENARENGVSLMLDAPALKIERCGSEWVIDTPGDSIRTKYIVNAAGLFADEIAALAGDGSFRITPFRGEEYLLDRNVGGLVNHVIETASLGVIAVPMVHGNLMIGTNRVETVKDDFNTTGSALEGVLRNIQTILPGILRKDIITSFAGLRAINNVTDDFIIGSSRKAENLINVSIGSPGVYATPAIAKMVLKILKDLGLPFEERKEFNPYRHAIVDFKNLSVEEQERLIKEDPRYGHVICRCETITEGQIVEAIKRGAKTLDGVKYRTRAGMGRCQGGFCSPRVLKILSRELGIPMTELTKKGEGSVILPYQAKELLEEAEE
jgi:glycerol-3-phosphate dehydrogenase